LHVYILRLQIYKAVFTKSCFVERGIFLVDIWQCHFKFTVTSVHFLDNGWRSSINAIDFVKNNYTTAGIDTKQVKPTG